MLQAAGGGGDGGREVVFRLRLLPDPDSKKRLKAVGDEASKQQKRIDQSAIASARQRQSVEAKAAKESERLLQREQREKEKADKDDHRRQEKAADHFLALQLKSARTAKKLRQTIAQEKEQETRKATMLFERSNAQMIMANDQMTERLTSATESIARMGRGFAMLGLVGEENTQKLLQGLVKVQASFDLVVGGINAYTRLSRAVRAYQASVEAAAIAESALGAARSRTAVASVGRGIVGNVGTGAAGGAVGGGGVALVGATATFSKLGAAASTAAGALATIPAAIAAIATSVVALGAQAVSFGTSGKFIGADAMAKSGRLDPGTGGRAALKTFVGQTPMGALALAAGGFPRLFGDEGLAGREGKTGRMSRGRQGRLENEGRERLFEERASEIAGIQQQGEERRKQLIMDNLNLEKQITAEKLSGIRESIAGYKQALNLTQQRLVQEQSGLLSAKERFGQLSREDQARAIRAKRKGDREGSGALTRGERASVRLGGTRGAMEMAREGDVADAERVGFSGAFGGEEREEIARLEREKGALRISLEDRRELQIKVQRNDEMIAKEIAKSVVKATDENMPKLLAAVNRETAKLIAEANRQHGQQISQAIANRVGA